MRWPTGSRPGVSAKRSANPSIAELSNGGRSTAAVAGSASTLPRASLKETVSAGSGSTRSRTSRCASSTEIRFRVGAATSPISYCGDGRDDRRPLSPGKTTRRGCDGRGVARGRHAARARGRGQARPRRRRRCTFRARGARRRLTVPSEHRPLVRLRRGRRPSVHGLRALAGRDARGSSAGGHAARRPGDGANRDRGRRGARARTRERRRPPRPEAGEHRLRRGGPSQDLRLRHRARHGRRHADRGRDADRHRRLHVARAGIRRTRDSGERRLLLRRDPLPDAGGTAPVRVDERRRSRPAPAPRRTCADFRAPARRAADARRSRRRVARQGSSRPAGRRPRARRAPLRRSRADARRRGSGGHAGARTASETRNLADRDRPDRARRPRTRRSGARARAHERLGVVAHVGHDDPADDVAGASSSSAAPASSAAATSASAAAASTATAAAHRRPP